MEEIKEPGKILFPELSYQIMGLIFEVFNQLGPGFTEVIYEKALIHELERHGIPFEAQKCIDVYYKGQNLGEFRLDLIIDGKIILELKAVKELSDLFRRQLASYLKATGIPLGILVNFGADRVQSTRIVLDTYSK